VSSLCDERANTLRADDMVSVQAVLSAGVETPALTPAFGNACSSCGAVTGIDFSNSLASNSNVDTLRATSSWQ
jgi:hypothetical protein